MSSTLRHVQTGTLEVVKRTRDQLVIDVSARQEAVLEREKKWCAKPAEEVIAKSTLRRWRTMQSIDPDRQALEASDPDQFQLEVLKDYLDPAWIEEAMIEVGCREQRRRKLPADFMIYFIIMLGLFRRTSYRNPCEKLHETRWTLAAWGTDSPPTSHAITEARDRLGSEVMARLFWKSSVWWEYGSKGRSLAGLRCYALDGVCLKAPDTPENRDRYGVPGASRGSSAFPQMRAVLLVDVATHLVRAERHGPYKVGEITLAKDVIQDIYPGMLIIMDRNFFNYEFLVALSERSAEFLVRAKRKSMKMRAYEHLGPGDDLVWAWLPGSAKRRNPDLPKRIQMRRIIYRPKGGSEDIILLTTLMDPVAASADSLAKAYQHRWEGESALDEFKTHLCDGATVNRPVVFRSKIPDRVEQEFYGLLIAFNVICQIKASVAKDGDKSPGVISFVATAERIREALQDMLWVPVGILEARLQQMKRAILRGVFERRPGRSIPRVVRVKMSKFPLKKREHAA